MNEEQLSIYQITRATSVGCSLFVNANATARELSGLCDGLDMADEILRAFNAVKLRKSDEIYLESATQTLKKTSSRYELRLAVIREELDNAKGN